MIIWAPTLEFSAFPFYDFRARSSKPDENLHRLAINVFTKSPPLLYLKVITLNIAYTDAEFHDPNRYTHDQSRALQRRGLAQIGRLTQLKDITQGQDTVYYRKGRLLGGAG